MTDWDQPLYLYFLDRELGRLMANPVGPEATERIMKALLLGTTSTFYCGTSLLWESPGLDANLIPFVSCLVRHGVLDVVSHHITAGEFLESRRVLYAHDVARYPMYFSSSADQSLLAIEPTRYKDDSTTRALSKELLDWALGHNNVGPRRGDNAEALTNAMKAVSTVLVTRAGQAITLSLFEQPSAASASRSSVSAIIQREISRLYVSHYLDFAEGDIPTGLPRLDYFEVELARGFPLYDIAVISAVLDVLGFAPVVEQPWHKQDHMWEELRGWRGTFAHAEFRATLRLLLRALADSVLKTRVLRNNYAVREAMLAAIRQLGVKNRALDKVDWTDVFYRLTSLSKQLRKDRNFDVSLDTLMQESGHHQVDVLLVTVADVERDAIVKAFREEIGHDAILSSGKRKTYYELGVLGGARVVMVQSEMGSVGPGAALSTVSDACDELHPKAVVAVGVAFGVDDNKQGIGDVLVSKQMHAYEPQRVGTTESGSAAIIPRGSTVDASARMLDRLRAAAAGWEHAKVRFGLMVSGEKLIDNAGFKDELKTRCPEAIGGEMEGAGTYSAAVQRNTDWIVVKGICDWADGNKRVRKKQRQELAARNAALLVLRAIKLGGLAGTSFSGS